LQSLLNKNAKHIFACKKEICQVEPWQPFSAESKWKTVFIAVEMQKEN
jgi:hypothetical protein